MEIHRFQIYLPKCSGCTLRQMFKYEILLTCRMHFLKWHKISNLEMSGDIQEVNVIICLKSHTFYTKYMQHMLLKCPSFCFFKYYCISMTDSVASPSVECCTCRKPAWILRDNAQKPSRVHAKARFVERIMDGIWL